MSDETDYLIFLIEQYAVRKGMTGDEVYSLFEKNDLLTHVRNMYYTYHTERVENAIEDIDRELCI
jgi:hypothetical protein